MCGDKNIDKLDSVHLVISHIYFLSARLGLLVQLGH